MQLANKSAILAEHTCLMSKNLQREVKIDFFLPRKSDGSSPLSLLLINDGQDMEKMHFISILDLLYAKEAIEPLNENKAQQQHSCIEQGNSGQ